VRTRRVHRAPAAALTRVALASRRVLVALQPPPGWTGGVGFITEEAIKTYLPPPGEGVKIVLCGPPGMCKALKPVLANVYPPEQWFSFM